MISKTYQWQIDARNTTLIPVDELTVLVGTMLCSIIISLQRKILQYNTFVRGITPQNRRITTRHYPAIMQQNKYGFWAVKIKVMISN